MGKHNQVLQQVLSGRADQNISFHDLVAMLVRLGFQQRRGKGSHVVLTRPNFIERLTLQPDGSKAKAYQVRQARSVITRHHLFLDEQA